ncbi:sensor histidine kinase [Pedobacter frigoris]|uniref:histidine kinase n=1 Tax=Pedobacter frigoris TaxID=2571272 RepID=A0A4U1CPR6_9SPHI|nr:HAMP domain-containing sensor histidine kinase [Pedobacter frigoris]TKC08880.1 HAMP domain-containing histidine kinase [Pedobacter frigoris]
MTIELITSPAQPYGPNVHFLYQVDSGQLRFLHPDFNWVVSEGADLVAQLLAMISAEDVPRQIETYHQVIQGHYNGSITLKLDTPDGRRWLEISPFLASYESSTVLFGTLKEVTGEILNMESIARYANKKNSILHMLAHDLRGPLNMAKSVVKIVDRELAEPGLRRKTSYIAGVLQQSIDLIADLVAREFLETTAVVLVKKQVNIVEKLLEYLEECKRSEDLAQRSFSLKSSRDEIFINLDHAKFMQVINNLMSNALKFTNQGGAIILQVFDEVEQVRFSFSDDGIGIPKSQLSEIFEKFTAARKPGLHGEPTLGLGLSIVETIIGWHGGRIWCESEEGAGSTFHFIIPKL